MTDSPREILLSGAWTCQESFLDSWITPHVVKPVIKTSRFSFSFCHISSTRRFEEESIFSNRAKTLLYLQYGKAPANIDFICFANKGVSTDTGNRDQVFLAAPLGLFSNLPLPITSCVKTYETYEMELWWLLLLADIFRQQNIEVSKCDRFCPGNFIVWSLDMSREFP